MEQTQRNEIVMKEMEKEGVRIEVDGGGTRGEW